MGRCPQGVACRFGSKHITEDGFNIVNKDVYEEYKLKPKTIFNQVSKDLLHSLRRRTYDFSLSETTVKNNDSYKKLEKQKQIEKKAESESDKCDDTSTQVTSGCVTDEDVVKLRLEEKKKIDWKDKLYLSPLTTVGNLPFR